MTVPWASVSQRLLNTNLIQEERTRMKGTGSSWLGAQGIGRVLAAGLLTVVTSCGGGEGAGGSQRSQWGPLAVVEEATGAEARTEGTIEITDRCVLLDIGGESMLLVWPEEYTSWKGQDRTIGFVTNSGERIELRNGHRVAFGGGASSLTEGGGTAEEYLDAVDWVSEPLRDCVTDIRWSINDFLGETGS